MTVELTAQSVIISGYEESNLDFCYIRPASIMPLPKASPRKRSNRKKGKSRVYTDTRNRDEVAKQVIEKAGKKSKKSAKNVKRKLFSQKKRAAKHAVVSSSSDGGDVMHDDESDCDSLDEIVEANVGDYVVVLVSRKSRTLKYIARVDEFDGKDYEGIFLQKVNRKIIPGDNNTAPTFIINEGDDASFAPQDIVLKLPAPLIIGGSSKKSSQLRFDYDFSKLDLA